MNHPLRKHIALLSALVLVCIRGSNYNIQKVVLGHLGPGALIFARYVVTPICATTLLLWKYGFHWPRLSTRDWLTLAGLATSGHLAHVSVMTHATHLSTPFSSALIFACGPVFTLLIVRFIRRENLSRVQTFGVALALAGVLIFLSEKLSGPREQGLGDLLLLSAALLFSAHTVVAGGVIARHGVALVMAYSTLLAAPPLLAINAPAALSADWSDMPVALWLGLTWSLAIASFAGWLVWGWLNVELGVPRSAPLLYLLPLVAGLISWGLLGESFGISKIVGALIALAGVAVAQFGPAVKRGGVAG